MRYGRGQTRQALALAVGLTLLVLGAVSLAQDYIVQFCTKCGAENQEGSRFCRSCGEALVAQARVSLRLTAKNAPLFAGPEKDAAGEDPQLGTLSQNAEMKFLESGTSRYKVRLTGDSFWLDGWVDKGVVSADVGRVFEAGPIVHPLSAEETSLYLERCKRDGQRLIELRRFGHIAYQSAISLYEQALREERDGGGTRRSRDKVSRLFASAEDWKRRQDKYFGLRATWDSPGPAPAPETPLAPEAGSR